jgi:UPF0755 protein
MNGDILPPQRSGKSGSDKGKPQTTNVPSEKKVGLVANPELSDIQLHDHSADNNATRATKRGALGRKASVVAAVCIGLITLLLATMVWYGQQLKPVDPASEDKIKISVQSGEGLSQIARTLRQNGLIRSELAFEWYVRQSGKTSLLQVGTYRLGKSEDVPAIVKHLTSGNTDSFSITFLPGATLAQHRKVLIATGYDETQVDAALAKTYSGPLFNGKPASADLEGYIYGETYNFAADATPEQILQYVFDYYAEVIKKNDLTNLYKKQGFSLYQGITMASIIQREVATASDAAQVAQVFKKRYDMGMQLGSDVTYQYIADKTGQARRVDFDSPYNTRRYTGLPPGPISSPGIDALKAVANPAPGDYVYFLSGDDDKTYFARTNEEHEKNIRDHCQKKCQII